MRFNTDFNIEKTEFCPYFDKEELNSYEIKPPSKEKNISHTELEVCLDYPLSGKFFFKIKSKTGWSQLSLCKKICQLYRKIYDKEDKTATKGKGLIPGMFNRDYSNGKYGIWGHGIGDLVIESVSIKKRKNKCPLVEVDVGS